MSGTPCRACGADTADPRRPYWRSATPIAALVGVVVARHWWLSLRLWVCSAAFLRIVAVQCTHEQRRR
jgi:hypothetical protein